MTDRMARRLADARAESGNIKKRAYADLQKLSRTFLGLLLIADDLTDVGDLEESAARARANCEEATKELAGKRAEIEKAQAEHTHMQAEFKKLIESMREEFRKAEQDLVQSIEARDRAVSDAKTLAAEIIEKAHLEAVALVATARNEGMELIRAADAEAELREQNAQSYIEEAKSRLGAVEIEITTANATLAGIRATIAKYAAV